MKVIIIKTFIRLFFLAFLFVLPVSVVAQKLPDIQENSMRPPANIKIDGKAVEWENTFQANNKNADIFYTISNDDTKLYLTLQARNENTIRKIVLGGVTFTINGSGKNKDIDGVAITYPAYEQAEALFYLTLDNKPETTNDPLKDKFQIDSFINERNKQLNDRFKTIKVKGITGIEDSILSIYNEEGIRAASLLDNNICYTYELAVPLKYLGIKINKPIEFNYNIKLDGVLRNAQKIKIYPGRQGEIITYTRDEESNNYKTLGISTPENLYLLYPTDFSGEYRLSE